MAPITRSTRPYRRSGTRSRPTVTPWLGLTDEELLDYRLCDLGLRIRGTAVEPWVRQLRRQLQARGIRVHPPCWLSDEWFAPERVPGIAIPFYLAHPRLMRLEEGQMGEVEGGTKAWGMQLLRHEAGHAVETAFRLSRRPRWRRTFGSPSETYPEHYRPDPHSREHVLHLDWWYAQSHPTEDFAETFAVWLDPTSRWRTRYREWRVALHKLEYVDDLMADLAGRVPTLTSRDPVDPLHLLRRTLREHYRRKRARYLSTGPQAYDADLRRLFSPSATHPEHPSAAAHLRREAPALRKHLATGSVDSAYTINLALKEVAIRSRELDLRVTRGTDQIRRELIDLIGTITDDLYRTDHWIPL